MINTWANEMKTIISRTLRGLTLLAFCVTRSSGSKADWGDVTYSTKIGKSDLDLNARWIHDFDVSKAVEGDGFNFTASLKF
jgi:hypothetical protein